MKEKRRTVAFLLVMSMMMSIFTGLDLGKIGVRAAEKNEIIFGASVMAGDYYAYPNVTINMKNESNLLYHLSISVDNGFIMLSDTTLGGQNGVGVLRTELGTDVAIETPITATSKYESISYDLSTGVSKDTLKDFISKIHFYKEGDKVQKVSMSASGVHDTKATIDGNQYAVKYFNGHFYAYVSNGKTWDMAYNNAKKASFAGLPGYLLTITSAAEDNFIWSAFGDNSGGSIRAKQGWMGCTRTTVAEGFHYDEKDVTWNPLPQFNVDDVSQNVWRWVCGPENEAGKIFGYQSDALGWSGGTSKEGDFVTAPGWFSNWNKNAGNQPKEPNGGKNAAFSNSNADEGYGYYGESNKGNWNDHPMSSWKGYYVEFGGYANDEELLDESVVLIEEEINSDGTKPTPRPDFIPGETIPPVPSASPSASPTVAPTSQPSEVPASIAPKTPITGIPVIESTAKDSAGNPTIKVGTPLKANIAGVGPQGAKDSNSLTYQWLVKGKDGNWSAIPGAIYPNYVLTADTVDHDLKVEVTGVNQYYGTVTSVPFDATRTVADVVPTSTSDPNGTRTKTIVVDPTSSDTVYAIKDDKGNTLYPNVVPAKDGEGKERQPDANQTKYPGYYKGVDGDKLIFTVDPDKTYIISEIKLTNENEEVVCPDIPAADVKIDKTSILIDPAKKENVYAILKKNPDGTYSVVNVKKDATMGDYVADPTSTGVWSTGEESKVQFSALTPGDNYRIVAIGKDVLAKNPDLDPTKLVGGYDITTATTSVEGDKANAPTATPAWGGIGQPIKPGSIELNIPTIVMKKVMGPKMKFQIKLLNYKGAVVKCSTSNKKLATITKKGLVKTKKKTGKCKLVINVSKGKHKIQYIVNLVVRKSCKKNYSLYKYKTGYKYPSVSLYKLLPKGKTYKVQLKHLAKGAKIKYKSSNKKIVTVNKKGKCKPKKVGRADVTISVKESGVEYRYFVVVRVTKKGVESNTSYLKVIK